MQNTAGFKTTASPSWASALLVGSNNVKRARFATALDGTVYLLVATAADLVVIDWANKTRLGYASLAGGFHVADMAADTIYATSITNGTVYKIALASVSGNSTASLSVFWSTSVAVDLISLSANTAFDLRCRTIGTTIGSVFVLTSSPKKMYRATVRGAGATSAVCDFGGDALAGDFIDKSIAHHANRFAHAFFDTANIAASTKPHVSWGRVYDDFGDASIADFWDTALDAESTGSIAETGGVLRFTHNSSAGNLALATSELLASLGGPIGVEVDWDVSAWPALASGKTMIAGIEAWFRDDPNTLFSIYKNIDDDGDGVMACAYDTSHAALDTEAEVAWTETSGRFRIIRSNNEDEPADWDNDYSYPDYDGVTTTPTPAYKIELQYENLSGDWVTLYTVRDDNTSALVFRLFTLTTMESGDGAVVTDFDNVTASDTSPECYRRLPADDIVSSSVVAMDESGAYRIALAYADQVFGFEVAGTYDDEYDLASGTIGRPIIEMGSSAWTPATDWPYGDAHEWLLGPPTDVALDGVNNNLFIGEEVGIVRVALGTEGIPQSVASRHYDSELPSQPVVYETINALDAANGVIAYATGDGAGAITPDETDPGPPTNAVGDYDGTVAPAKWDLSWTDATDTDFYATVIGYIATSDAQEEALIKWLCDETTGAAWRKADDWSDTFDDDADFNSDRWTAVGDFAITDGEATISVAAGDATAHTLTANAECLDCDVTVDFSDFAATASDPGDQVWFGLNHRIDNNNYVFIGRIKTNAANAWFAQVKISGGLHVNDTSNATTATAGSLRMVRVGNHVRLMVKESTDARFTAIAGYDAMGLTPAFLAMSMQSTDANAGCSVAFDNFTVSDARPRYDWQTDGVENDLLASLGRFHARTADEAGNFSASIGFEQRITTGDFEDDEDSDPWQDNFIIARTLAEPPAVIRRQEQETYRLGDAVPGTTNQGRMQLLSGAGSVSDSDFDVTVRTLSGGADANFALRPNHVGDGWMGRNGISTWADWRLVDSSSSGISHPHMATMPDGRLALFYGKSGRVHVAYVDQDTGDITHQTFAAQNRYLPACAYHRASNRTCVVMTDSTKRRLIAYVHRDGVWSKIGDIAPRQGSDILGMSMCSLRTFGTERLILAIVLDSDATPGVGYVYKSDDAGESWSTATTHSDMPLTMRQYESDGDISICAGPSDTGELALLSVGRNVMTGTHNPCMAYSRDGITWTNIDAPYETNNYRFHRAAALPQRTQVFGSQYYKPWSNWTFVVRDTGDQFRIEQTLVDRPPHRWGSVMVALTTGSNIDRRDALDGGINTSGPIESRPYPSGVALTAWDYRLAMAVVKTTRSGDSALVFSRALHWQRPSEIREYGYAWIPAFGLPDVHGSWTRTASGQVPSVTDEYMRHLTTGSDYTYWRQASLADSASLDTGIRVRFTARIILAGANTKHGVSVRLGNSSQSAHITLYFTGARRFRLYDENDNAWLTDDITIGTLADIGKAFEFIIAVSTNDDDDPVARVWYRVAEGDRHDAYFEASDLLTPESGASVTSRIDFGALSGSTGVTDWFSFQYGAYDSGLVLDDTGNTMDLNERQNARRNGGLFLPTDRRVELVDGAACITSGGLPSAGDTWDIAAVSTTPAEALFSRGNSKWQSETDNVWIDLRFRYDATLTDELFRPGGIGLFGVNFPAAWVYFNNTDTWTSPSVTIGADSEEFNGTLGSATGSAIAWATLFRRYRPGTMTNDRPWRNVIYDHELVGMYLRMTSGAAQGNVYLVRGNSADHLFFAGAKPSDDGAISGDEFRVFGRRLVGFPNAANDAASEGGYSYCRLLIPASKTHEGYYQFGAFVVGPRFTVPSIASCRRYPWNDQITFPADMKRRTDGTLDPKRLGAPRRVVNLGWNGLDRPQQLALMAFMGAVDGPNTPVVYTPVHRPGADGTATRGLPEARLYRIATETPSVETMAEVDWWQSANITLEEIAM